MDEPKRRAEWAQGRYLTKPRELEELWEYIKDPLRQPNVLLFLVNYSSEYRHRVAAFRPRVGTARMVGIHRTLAHRLTSFLGVDLGDHDAIVIRQRRSGERQLAAQKITSSRDDVLVRKLGDLLFKETLDAGPARDEQRKRRRERLQARRHTPPAATEPESAAPAKSVTPALIAHRSQFGRATAEASHLRRARDPRRAAAAAPTADPLQLSRRVKPSAQASYRAFWPVEGPVVATVREELLTWLEQKGVPAALVEAESDTAEVGGRQFEWTFDVGQADGARALSLTMREPSDGSTFTTEVSAYEGSNGASWVFLRVHNDAGRFAATPRLAKSLIKALKVREGGHLLTNKPRSLNAESLLALLEDPQRRLPVVVAGSDERLGDDAADAFRERMTEWTSSVAGQAHLVVLDSQTTTEFNDALDDELEVWPWAMRIYRPGFERHEAEQAPNHRYLATSYLARAEFGQIKGRLIALVRNTAQQGEIPSELSKATLLLDRVARDRQQEAIRTKAQETATAVAAKAEVETPSTHLTDSERLMAELGRFVLALYDADELTEDVLEDVEDKLTAPDLSEAMDAVQADLSAQEDIVAELELLVEEMRDDADAEIDALERRFDAVMRERNFYQQELAKKDAKLAYHSYVDDDPLAGIDDIETVLSRCHELDFVEVTWDEGIVREIPEWDKHDIVPKGAWRALLALNSYGELACGDEGFNGNFLDFVSQGSTLLGPSKVALKESNQTMQQFGDERVFRVPMSVDPSGEIPMEAHIRIGSSSGGLATRMHFYDDTARSGKIYVGYLGEHLSNTQTKNM